MWVWSQCARGQLCQNLPMLSGTRAPDDHELRQYGIDFAGAVGGEGGKML